MPALTGVLGENPALPKGAWSSETTNAIERISAETGASAHDVPHARLSRNGPEDGFWIVYVSVPPRSFSPAPTPPIRCPA